MGWYAPSRFEQFLLDNGYNRYKKDIKKRRGERQVTYVPGEPTDYLSSMGDLYFFYKKEGEKIEFCWGLSEYQKPETLVYPRPIINEPKQIGDGWWDMGFPLDDAMNRLLKKYSCQEIYDAIISGSILPL